MSVSRVWPRLQGHAFWHLLMGLNSYFGPAFAQFVHAEKVGTRAPRPQPAHCARAQEGLRPHVRYAACGLIPYVTIEKTE